MPLANNERLLGWKQNERTLERRHFYSLVITSLELSGFLLMCFFLPSTTASSHQLTKTCTVNNTTQHGPAQATSRTLRSVALIRLQLKQYRKPSVSSLQSPVFLSISLFFQAIHPPKDCSLITRAHICMVIIIRRRVTIWSLYGSEVTEQVSANPLHFAGAILLESNHPIIARLSCLVTRHSVR